MNSIIINISKNIGLFTAVSAFSYGFYINLRPDHDFAGKQPILYKYYLRRVN